MILSCRLEHLDGPNVQQERQGVGQSSYNLEISMSRAGLYFKVGGPNKMGDRYRGGAYRVGRYQNSIGQTKARGPAEEN